VDAKLPDKRYMKIGEVSRLTSLNSSVLRFWESEFDQLQPLKSRSGQRLYTREDLELILKIRNLLYREKLTIAGAKSRIARASVLQESAPIRAVGSVNPLELLNEVRRELQDLRDSLE